MTGAKYLDSVLAERNLLIDLYIIHDTHAVIPAKAGIQWVKQNAFLPCWIPAFTGMTACVS